MIEDIFAENLVDEPDDIERVIEDGEEIRRDSGEGSDDEDKKKDQEKEKEKPKIRKTLGPRVVLNAQRLKGPRGIATMKEFFKDVKLDGRKGKEEKDLDVVMKRLELWVHRLYPKGQFDDCLNKIEHLGTNKLVRNYVTRIRLGMEDEGGEADVIRDEPNSPPHVSSVEDPFDQLVSSSAGHAATTGSDMNYSSSFRLGEENGSGYPNVSSLGLSSMAPAASSESGELTTEQRERMLMNRLIAEERRAARIKRAQELKEKFKAQQASNSNDRENEVRSSVEGEAANGEVSGRNDSE